MLCLHQPVVCGCQPWRTGGFVEATALTSPDRLWIEQSEPWDLESQLISQLDLPLNLDQNRHNAFHSRLKELRAQARQRARELPISS